MSEATINENSEITVHFRYKEEKQILAWCSYNDTVTFSDYDTAMRYVNKEETVYDYLDETIEPQEDKIPLYITDSNNKVLWENETYVKEMLDKIKNGEIPKEKSVENILTLRGMKYIKDFYIGAKDEIIGADFLSQTIYENNRRVYHGYLTSDPETKNDYYIEFNNDEIESISYKKETIIDYNVLSAKPRKNISKNHIR